MFVGVGGGVGVGVGVSVGTVATLPWQRCHGNVATATCTVATLPWQRCHGNVRRGNVPTATCTVATLPWQRCHGNVATATLPRHRGHAVEKRVATPWQNRGHGGVRSSSSSSTLFGRKGSVAGNLAHSFARTTRRARHERAVTTLPWQRCHSARCRGNAAVATLPWQRCRGNVAMATLPR